MANYTITYADSAQGFPSFYSYYPDWMIGMNNYFYTFKGGNLYRHNVNSTRNTFYYDWNQRLTPANDGFTPTKLTSVFNQSPLENKLFKTLNLEGDDSWAATMVTDLQNSGNVSKEWFEKKESSWYAFVRNSGDNPATVEQYSLRSMNGLGTSLNVSGTPGATVIDFPISPLVTLTGSLSVGDFFYFVTGAIGGTPFFAGQVDAINVDLPRGINQVVINTIYPLPPASPTTTPIPSTTEYFMFLKDAVAESHGVLGHYCIFDIENNNREEINLFAVESEVMKSYP